jgi:hypothetical protein
MAGPQLALLLAKDYSKADAPWGERCFVYFAQLVELLMSGVSDG